MKKQIVTIALGFITIASFGQKDELKAADKALKKQDFAAAVTSINSAEGLIANADDKTKSKFYFLKGKAFGGKKEYGTAAKAYHNLFSFENELGKKWYTDEALSLLTALKAEVIQEAFTLNDAKKYKEASNAFYVRYTLDKKDTMFLSNAAQLALKAQDYDTSLTYYTALKDLKYTGIKDVFKATNKKTNEIGTFNSEREMNIMIKAGKYIEPKITKTTSTRNSILKNLVSILSKEKKFEEAVDLIQGIRKQEPDNLELLLAEAFLYNDLKQPKKFEALLKEATEKEPTNPDLFFNIGSVNFNAKNIDQAVKYFSKAIALKADYPKGNWMLANTLLLKDEGIVKKMNDLPPSDFKNYDKYQAERKELFSDVLVVLTKADETARTAGTVRLLVGVYEQLDMSDGADEFRGILKTLE
jgi:tetratricopeptide (TPR) repeat protein